MNELNQIIDEFHKKIISDEYTYADWEIFKKKIIAWHKREFKDEIISQIIYWSKWGLGKEQIIEKLDKHFAEFEGS